VIVAWSVLERTLRLVAYALTADTPIDENGDRTAAVVFEGMATRTLVGIMHSLIAMRHPADVRFAKVVGDRIMKAKTHRDLLAHSIFQAGEKEGTLHPLSIKTVGGLKQAKGEFSVDDTLAWQKEIGELSALLLTILVRWNYFSFPE
jgi:hypothetical protein